MVTKYSSSSSFKPSSSSHSKDAASSPKAKTCSWCTKYHPAKANRHGWHECSKLKEFNKSVPNEMGNANEQHVARYNLDTDSEIEGLIHQDAEVSTTTKSVFNSGASTHLTQDAVLFRDIWSIRSEVRVRNGTAIPVYGISTDSLFVILKDGSINNVLLKGCLYVPGIMKSLFSCSKLTSLK
jgi:hypothetical protein